VVGGNILIRIKIEDEGDDELLGQIEHPSVSSFFLFWVATTQLGAWQAKGL